MIVPNTVGVVVIEALKTLKKPVPLTEIISTVASILECPQQQVMDLVTVAVKGGVRYGYIQESRQRFAFFPINLSGLSDDDNMYRPKKEKSRTNLKKQRTTNGEFTRYRSAVQVMKSQSNGRVSIKRSSSTCTYTRSKQHLHSPCTQKAITSKVEPSSSKYTSLTSTKGTQESKAKLKSKWRG